MTRRRFEKLGGLFVLGIVRLFVLLLLLVVILDFPPVAQLILLPAGLTFIVVRYVCQSPHLRWRRLLRPWISPTLAAEPTAFANARERAALLLRRPPSYPRLALAMLIIAVFVPFAVGVVGGDCARGGLIRVGSGSPLTGASAGRVVQLVTSSFVLVWLVLIEEFTMRGWLLFPLRKLLNAPAAVAITSYLFAVMHFIPSVTQYHLLVGVILGTAAVLTDSIWFPVGVHLAHNLAVSAWAGFFAAFGPGAISCTGARPAFLVLTAALFYTLWISRRRKPRTLTPSYLETSPQ